MHPSIRSDRLERDDKRNFRNCLTIVLRDIVRNALFIPHRLLNASRKSAEFTNIEYLKVNNIYYSATVCILILSAQIRQGN